MKSRFHLNFHGNEIQWKRDGMESTAARGTQQLMKSIEGSWGAVPALAALFLFISHSSLFCCCGQLATQKRWNEERKANSFHFIKDIPLNERQKVVFPFVSFPFVFMNDSFPLVSFLALVFSLCGALAAAAAHNPLREQTSQGNQRKATIHSAPREQQPIHFIHELDCSLGRQGRSKWNQFNLPIRKRRLKLISCCWWPARFAYSFCLHSTSTIISFIDS